MSRTSKFRRDSKKNKDKIKLNRLKSSKGDVGGRFLSGPSMSMFESPLNNISDEQRRELISVLGKNGREKVVELLDSLDCTLRKYNPIMLIAVLSGYGLTVGAGADGVQTKESPGNLSQSHVELLQAIALKIPESEKGWLPATPDVVQKTQDQLIEVSQAFSLSRMNPEILDDSEADKAIATVQEFIRAHTQNVRNWGYHSQVVDISREMYSYFDEPIRSKFGFSVTNIISVFKVLIEDVERRFTERLNALRVLRSIKKSRRMVVKYFEMIGQEESEADVFIEKIGAKHMSRNSLFFLLLSHYDIRMPSLFLIDSDELAGRLCIDAEVINNILGYFSYSFGGLAGGRREFFFLDNPVWGKPVISTREGYYCMLPQLFFSFILNTLDEMVEGVDKKSLHKRRADYLELKIEEIVKRRFPESKVVSGVTWGLGEDRYETDLIAFIDSHAIIIEAKSQKISRSALRGAPERIKRHLQEILLEPGVQSFRLEKKLNELRVMEAPNDPMLEKLPVDIRSVKKILRTSVSLEDFATLQTNLQFFDSTGWVPSEFSPCPSMNLADFEILFDLLEHPVQIVHYLLRRSEIEANYKIMGDELDLMGFYVSNLFNFEHMVGAEKSMMMIPGMSKSLDKYYTSRDQGIFIKKPSPKLSPLFKRIFERLEERATPRWTEIGCILNRFPLEAQLELTSSLDKLSKIVNRTWQLEGHKNMVIYSPPEASEYALAVVLFKNDNHEKRHEFIEHASALALGPEHVRYCLMIAINIDRKNHPYHAIGLFEDREYSQ